MSAPRSLEELARRARALDGRTLEELARDVGSIAPRGGLHAKGKWGELCELVLGATGGSRQVVDFPELGVELKTLPLGKGDRPIESTYVCRFRLEEAETATWETSWVREKLALVLFLPIVDVDAAPRIEGPFLWRPTAADEARLREDFDELVGLVGAGKIEALSAHRGRVLQVRPKAKDGVKRKALLAADGDYVDTVPRGFYLRASFTAQLVARARAGAARPGS